MASRSETSTETREARDRQVHPTNAPITEDERALDRERAEGEALRRPFPWLMMGAAAALVGVAIVAGAVAGWSYLIPFALLGLAIAIFVGGHRLLGAMQTRRYDRGAGPAEEKAPGDESDPVPHLGFDEKSQLGATAQTSGEEEQAHADAERSTGER
jgi:nitrogen fixation-related uncharacterized protein